MEIQEILVFFAVLGGGAFLWYGASKHFYKIWLIKKSTEAQIHNAASTDGFVRIHGKAQQSNDVLESPIEGAECLSYEYEIEKNTRNGATKEHNAWWKSLDDGSESVEFTVEDPTGKANIQTDAVSLEYDTVHMISNESEIPENVGVDLIQIAKQGLESKSGTINRNRRIRLREGTIQPDDRIFVLGEFVDENGVINLDDHWTDVHFKQRC